jgi:hypothetical protein
LNKNTTDLIDKYQQLQTKVRDYQKWIAEAEGKTQLLMEDLKTKFGCTGLKEANELLDNLTTVNEQKQDELGRRIDQFEKKWRSKIDELQE